MKAEQNPRQNPPQRPPELPASIAKSVDKSVDKSVGASGAARPRPQAGALSVLTADGDAIVQRILRTAFERRGWAVRQAADGREALESMESEPFDLFVLDLNLAFINGFELLEALAKHPAPQRARAIVISAQTQPTPVLRAFGLGADDFVDKPLIPEILLARIDRLFKPASR